MLTQGIFEWIDRRVGQCALPYHCQRRMEYCRNPLGFKETVQPIRMPSSHDSTDVQSWSIKEIFDQ
jgi:hypothetical protein